MFPATRYGPPAGVHVPLTAPAAIVVPVGPEYQTSTNVRPTSLLDASSSCTTTRFRPPTSPSVFDVFVIDHAPWYGVYVAALPFTLIDLVTSAFGPPLSIIAP